MLVLQPLKELILVLLVLAAQVKQEILPLSVTMEILN